MEDYDKMIRSISRIIYSCQRFLNKEIGLEDLISFVDENNKFVGKDILKNKINNYVSIFEDVRSWYFDYNSSKDLTDKISFENKYNESYKEVFELYNFVTDFCKKEGIILFIKDLNGLIVYGKYKYYSVYINHDSDTNQYNIYLWKKDSNENSLEINIRDEKELQKFFEDNNILVKWEENKEN